jgi:type I restriction enzyme M protein
MKKLTLSQLEQYLS